MQKSSFQNKPRKPLKQTGFKKTTPKPKKRLKRKNKRSKTPSIRLLKQKLWKECRRIIINRHGNNCYTCASADLSGSGLHAGHFIPSSICSAEMRYDLENLRPQCFACNIHRSGNWVAYERHLIRDNIDVEALKQRNEDTKGEKYDHHWYSAKINEYKEL